MPRDIHAALRTAADAAATLRAQLSDLAAAVEQGNEGAIVLAARALVVSNAAVADPHSPDTPGTGTDSGPPRGESP